MLDRPVQPSHHLNPVHVEVAAANPYAVGADLVAVTAGPPAAELGAPRRAIAEADPVAIVYRHAAACAMPLAVVAHPTNMLGPALLQEDRGDAVGRGATGYGVRRLVELATRLSGVR
jgi:hypothetical protein